MTPIIDTPFTPGVAVSHTELVERARRLQPLLREQQAEAEERGHYSQQVHEEFVRAGFYHLLTPRKYGGLEAGLDTFAEVLVEIGRGDPATAWCLGLGIGHTLTLASYWSEKAQDEIFDNDFGYFRANHRFVAQGTAVPVDGGYLVDGTWDYCSGIQYASHFKATARVHRDGEPPAQIVVVIPIDQVEVLDDWRGDAILGMRASGSNSVRVDKVFVPEHWTVTMNWRPGQSDEIAPGAAIHGNPMYNGRIRLHYMLELTTPVVGAAQAAIDEYEHILRTRKTPPPNSVFRYEDPNYQRDFGLALGYADSARTLLVAAAREYMVASAEWVHGSTPFGIDRDQRLRTVALEAGKLACEAVDIVWRTSGSSSSKKESPIARYFRDASVWRQHQGTQYMSQAPGVAKAYFGTLNATGAI